jgi:hypothetical protein
MLAAFALRERGLIGDRKCQEVLEWGRREIEIAQERIRLKGKDPEEIRFQDLAVLKDV